MNEIQVAVQGARGYLAEHPDEVRYRDGAAVASLLDGLRVGVNGSTPEAGAVTDMPSSVGGTGSAPSPGWLLRAAIASCVVTLITMTAAERGIALGHVTVTVDSESDDRGILGMDASVPAGPLSVRCAVDVQAPSAGEDPSALEELVRYAVDHCPVTDAVRRAIPLEVTTSYS
jgi:uncharacterized OsmC-like protein